MIPAQKLAKGGVDLNSLSGLAQTGPGRELLKAVRMLRDDYDQKMKSCPQISDENFKKDVKYQFGLIAALDEILALPDAAGEFLKNREGE